MQDLAKFLIDPIDIRRDVHKATLENFARYLTPDMTVYDVGCGKNPFKAYMTGKVKAYIGVDIQDGFYNPANVDMIGSAYDVPVTGGTADAVTSTQVLEHLEFPGKAIAETNRILKQDGLFLLSVPFIYPIHAEPHDFFRYTEYGMAALLKQHGFEVIEKRFHGGYWYLAGGLFGVNFNYLNNGPLKKFGIFRAFETFGKWIFYVFHTLEGLLFKAMKKNLEDHRAKWVCNYLFVTRKIKNL